MSDELKIIAACRAIESADSLPGLAQLACQANLSEAHFQRFFKKHLGCTPKQYANAAQRVRAHHALVDCARVSDAVFEAGFESPSRFYAKAHWMLGMDPAIFKSGGTHQYIEYAIAKSALGYVLVASTAYGLCSVALDDSPAVLKRNLYDKFPQAKVRDAGAAFSRIIGLVLSLIDCDKPSEYSIAQALPLDIQGSVFQEKIWRVLSGIPVGETMTYAQVANAIGKPNSHRAVANACGANELALIIPCHRVVRSDGGLGGYRWNIKRKQNLLAHEVQLAK